MIAQHFAQPNDTALENFGLRDGRLVAPEGIGKRPSTHNLSWMHRQCREDDAFAPCEVLPPPIPVNRERAKYGDTHSSRVRRIPVLVNTGDTRLIPAAAGAVPRRRTTVPSNLTERGVEP